MTTRNTLWLLPSRPDPEAAAISLLLADAQQQTATTWDDPRVVEMRYAGGCIYAIERTDIPEWTGYPDTQYTDCAALIIRIDHHAPGDPGYGRPPADFLPASSIGQVVSELARLGHEWAIPTDDILYVAAADHCLAAAYRGECPGVDPDRLMRWRVEQRAAHQGRSAENVRADIERARSALAAAPVLDLGRPGEPDAPLLVRDLRGQYWPELPEAGTRYGYDYLTAVPDPDGRTKVVVSGRGSVIRAFLEYWAPAEGLQELYGDPARGFAGGYR